MEESPPIGLTWSHAVMMIWKPGLEACSLRGLGLDLGQENGC